MGYPNLPQNRLIVNGVDLTTQFKMVLLDGYTLEPPSPKTYVVDIPGGNGKLDLTESLFNDVVYGNRNQEFTFAVIYPDDFEKVKTQVSNFLHGKSFNYTMTMDPGYTYHGRFTVSSYAHQMYANGRVGTFKVKVDADPYKLKAAQTFEFDCVGGQIFKLTSGRKPVRPKITTDGSLKVIFDGVLTTLPEGTWTVNDILFRSGENEIYLNSHDIHNLKWGELQTNKVTWGDFGQKRLFEWYRSNGLIDIVHMPWKSLEDKTWESLKDKKWSEIIYGTEEYVSDKKVYVSYEWGDL